MNNNNRRQLEDSPPNQGAKSPAYIKNSQ